MALFYKWRVSFNPKSGYANVFSSGTGFISGMAGFNVIHKFGGFEEEAFSDKSEKQIYVLAFNK